MQIHELTQPKLNEGVLDKIKGAASNAVDKGITSFAGATKAFGTGGVAEPGALKAFGTGGVAEPGAQPFVGQTAAQARAKTAQPNPAAAKKFGDMLVQAWANEVATAEQRLARSLDDNSYRNLLRKFIDKIFFKDKMELLDTTQKQTIEHSIDTITNLRDNPDQLAQNFTKLSQNLSGIRPDPDRTAALKPWIGKVMDVNLQPRNGGVSRAAKFSWDGTNWIDAFSGQRATEELSKELTNVALGTVR